MIDDPFTRSHGDPDDLVEGYYLVQFRRARRVNIPVRIWFGAPTDPDTGEEMDRSPRWQIHIAGVPFTEPLDFGGIRFNAVTDFWPTIAGNAIDATEYTFRVERAAWAQQHDPDDALATPGGRISAMNATLP